MDPAASGVALAPDTEPETFLNVERFTNGEITAMVDLIDHFRSLGLAQTVSLPQLVVAGNPSVGKSSLLENLTDIPFPIGAGMCTRFATEINIRRGERRSVVATIRSCDGQGEMNFVREREGKFDREYFKQLLEDASEFLGVDRHGGIDSRPQGAATEPGANPAGKGAIINDRVLVIDVTDPAYSLLSFVDTPALICFEKGKQDQVEDLVCRLIEQPRAIIVTVMSATSNYETQGIFALAKDKDPHGVRTVGVLTHCDKLEKGSGEERLAVNLASNTERPLAHGWFAIRNKSCLQHEEGVSLDQARLEEEELFASGPWRDISSGRGVSELRSYLINLFAEHVTKEFQNVLAEMREKLEVVEDELQRYGAARDSHESQKAYLLSVAESYRQSIKKQKRQYIWPSVKQFERIFQANMLEKGSKRKFGSVSVEPDAVADQSAGQPAGAIVATSHSLEPEHEDIYAHINQRYHDALGPSCHGLAPPELVEELFEEQTQPWREIALDFLSNVKDRMKKIIEETLKFASADIQVRNRLYRHFVGGLDSAFKHKQDELDKYLAGQSQRMYSIEQEDFHRQILSDRTYRLVVALKQLAGRKCTIEGNGEVQIGSLHFSDVLHRLFVSPEFLGGPTERTRDAVYEIHDILHRYYDLAVKRFMDHVISLSNDFIRGKDSPLLSFNSAWVDRLGETQLDMFASEDEVAREKRIALQRRVESLKEAIQLSEARVPGLEAFRAAPASKLPQTPIRQTTMCEPKYQGGSAELRKPPAVILGTPSDTSERNSASPWSISPAATTAQTSASASPAQFLGDKLKPSAEILSSTEQQTFREGSPRVHHVSPTPQRKAAWSASRSPLGPRDWNDKGVGVDEEEL